LVSKRKLDDPNLPLVFRENPETVKLRSKPATELIKRALDELEE